MNKELPASVLLAVALAFLAAVGWVVWDIASLPKVPAEPCKRYERRHVMQTMMVGKAMLLMPQWRNVCAEY